MRFILMGMATQESEAGPRPKPEAFAAMQEYNEDLAKRGILLAAEGLAPTSKGARVTFNDEERIVTDGPFAEAKEVDHQGELARRRDRSGEAHAEHFSERQGRGRDPQAHGRRRLR